ncbi:MULTISPECIES: NUDIX hydrolase [unclassified Lactococcus]|uniref:NUDIX hydrolase n=1 Tax=unclassified Lactococcus TaxID=2643510 RepID=UPI0011C93185|nr:MULTISPECIES: NUDIX hydrolase [unclassified Lactococcus]MQW23053.1 NUDIX domain-containing protein [Lactococcus sp. dk101]TXK44398.1 NUDIX hydrolase [Lactococcus sp. dk310]TXK50208.1 NUDIX hydrolase [Lactococcus sp. dk322]
MSEIPYFGEKLTNVTYVERLGVYGIVSRFDNSEICLIQAPNGSFFLPGGGIERGENQETALKRELIEELGVHAEVGTYFGQADEYFYSSHRDTYYHNPAFIYETTNAAFDQAPLEDFNGIFWFDVETAIDKLKRGSHKWGVQQWRSQL